MASSLNEVHYEALRSQLASFPAAPAELHIQDGNDDFRWTLRIYRMRGVRVEVMCNILGFCTAREYSVGEWAVLDFESFNLCVCELIGEHEQGGGQ